jgi:hypothetical protein
MSQASLILAVLEDQAPFGKKLDETVTNVNHLWRNRHSLPILESPAEFTNASHLGLDLWRSHNVSKVSLEIMYHFL